MREMDYLDLKTVFSDLDESFGKFSSGQEILKDYARSTFKQEVRVLLGSVLLGQSLSGSFELFKSNRFFLDSIGVDLVPSTERIESAKAELLKHRPTFFDPSVLDGFKREAELWLQSISCPSIFSNMATAKLTDVQRQHLDAQGYLVIKDAFSSDLADEVREKVLWIAERERKSGTSFHYGSGKLQRVYHLLNKQEIFRDLICHPLVLDVMEHIFDRPTLHEKFFLSSWHANILGPGAESQVWHVDAATPEPLPAWPVRANVNFLLEDYTRKNGATQCVPGSHTLLRKPKRDEAIDESDLLTLVGTKGSLVFWHGHLWHRSGSNVTDNARIGLVRCFAASHLREMALEENCFNVASDIPPAEFSRSLKKLVGADHGRKDPGLM